MCSYWNRPEMIFILFTTHLYVLSEHPSVAAQEAFPGLPLWILGELIILWLIEKVVAVMMKEKNNGNI